MTPGPTDGAGLHEERTVLAWRRTALAVLVAALASGRLLLGPAGPGAAAWVLGTGGVLGAALLLGPGRSRIGAAGPAVTLALAAVVTLGGTAVSAGVLTP